VKDWSRGTTRSEPAFEEVFNVNAVETSTRKFNGRIASDGVAVQSSAPLEALVQSNTSDEWDPSVIPKNGRRINTNGTDPVSLTLPLQPTRTTRVRDEDRIVQLVRYYEKSKVKLQLGEQRSGTRGGTIDRPSGVTTRLLDCRIKR
jgi:hypothetical protein